VLAEEKKGKERNQRRKRKNGAGAAGLDPAAASVAGADGQGVRSPWAAAAVRLR